MQFIERLTADAATLRGALRALRSTIPIAKHPTRVFPLVISELAHKYADAPALLSARERLTYSALAARANRYARWALREGIRKGDTICLLMSGRPEFLAVWIGISAVGGVVALLNTHLAGTALAHCINVVHPKHIIAEAELSPALETASIHFDANSIDAKIWMHGDARPNFPRIDRELEAFSGDDLARS